jgi:hypothetical protein
MEGCWFSAQWVDPTKDSDAADRYLCVVHITSLEFRDDVSAGRYKFLSEEERICDEAGTKSGER